MWKARSILPFGIESAHYQLVRKSLEDQNSKENITNLKTWCRWCKGINEKQKIDVPPQKIRQTSTWYEPRTSQQLLIASNKKSLHSYEAILFNQINVISTEWYYRISRPPRDTNKKLSGLQ